MKKRVKKNESYVNNFHILLPFFKNSNYFHFRSFFKNRNFRIFLFRTWAPQSTNSTFTIFSLPLSYFTHFSFLISYFTNSSHLLYQLYIKTHVVSNVSIFLIWKEYKFDVDFLRIIWGWNLSRRHEICHLVFSVSSYIFFLRTFNIWICTLLSWMLYILL